MNKFPWEDNLLERKVESDLKDLLKTLVAFANSVRPSHTAVILIGEKDDGTVAGVTNPDNIQKRVRDECDKIYPDIVWRSTVYQKEGKLCVRVEIEYSGDTPHFGGPAWIRRGSETIKASDEVFQRLIDIRSDAVRELSQWLDKEVTVYGEKASVPTERRSGFAVNVVTTFTHRWPWQETPAILRSVTKHWITLESKDNGEKKSEPLEKLILSYDDKRNQPKIIVLY
jgi:hypothetical protein